MGIVEKIRAISRRKDAASEWRARPFQMRPSFIRYSAILCLTISSLRRSVFRPIHIICFWLPADLMNCFIRPDYLRIKRHASHGRKNCFSLDPSDNFDGQLSLHYNSCTITHWKSSEVSSISFTSIIFCHWWSESAISISSSNPECRDYFYYRARSFSPTFEGRLDPHQKWWWFVGLLFLWGTLPFFHVIECPNYRQPFITPFF